MGVPAGAGPVQDDVRTARIPPCRVRLETVRDTRTGTFSAHRYFSLSNAGDNGSVKRRIGERRGGVGLLSERATLESYQPVHFSGKAKGSGVTVVTESNTHAGEARWILHAVQQSLAPSRLLQELDRPPVKIGQGAKDQTMGGVGPVIRRVLQVRSQAVTPWSPPGAGRAGSRSAPAPSRPAGTAAPRQPPGVVPGLHGCAGVRGGCPVRPTALAVRTTTRVGTGPGHPGRPGWGVSSPGPRRCAAHRPRRSRRWSRETCR